VKHLLLVVPWMAVGGADKFNLDLLACLRERGWRATVITTLAGDHPWRPAFAALSERIVDVGAHPPEQAPTRLLVAARDCGADTVLISNSTLGYRALPYLRAHLAHAAFVDYCHMPEPAWRNGGYPGLSVEYAPYLDRQIVSSQNLRDWMVARGADAQRIAVCTTNIDTADWHPRRYDGAAVRAEFEIPQHTPVVLYAGRLVDQKQPMLAAAVMAAVARQAGNVVFLVAGDGPYMGYLRAFVRRHGLQRQVRLLGAVSSTRMRELLAASTIFFLPSQNEGISLAVYEAMAMGVAPLAADVGGQAELVTPECGVLVARGPGERADYERALLRLLNNPLSLRRIGAAARERVERHFPLSQMGERMDALLREARAAHDASPPTPISPAAALAAARDAIAAARLDLAEARPGSGLRPRLRAAYWRLVDAGAWQLVPLADRLRALRANRRA
jgi:glycosyltransferase involved in cell wall biosynthesis